jgi:hypothetical protein
MGWDGPLGGGGESVGEEARDQKINNIIVCSMPSPFDVKGCCFGGGGMGRGPLVETYFFTLRNGTRALLFLLGVFFLRQIFVSRSDEKIGDKAH